MNSLSTYRGMWLRSPRGSPRPWRRYPGSFTRCPPHVLLETPPRHTLLIQPFSTAYLPGAHPQLLPHILPVPSIFFFYLSPSFPLCFCDGVYLWLSTCVLHSTTDKNLFKSISQLSRNFRTFFDFIFGVQNFYQISAHVSW